jgi:heptosyltransferase II
LTLALNLDKDAEALGLMRRLRTKRQMGFVAHEPTGKLTVANEASLHALRLGLDDELKFRLSKKTYPEIIAEMAEVEYRGEEYTLELSEKAIARARARLDEMCESVGVDRRLVLGLNTGTGSAFATKQWTAEGFAELARGFLQRHQGAVCLLLGGRAERAFNDEVLELTANHRLLDGGCDNGMEDFCALVDACSVMVSSDSLGMHVAIARRVPTVALFGPTTAQEVDLFGRGEKIVTDFPCSPCYLKHCPLDVSCMQALGGGTVLEAVERTIEIQNSEFKIQKDK